MNPRTDPERSAGDGLRAGMDLESTGVSPESALVPAKRARLDAIASLLADDSPSVVAEIRRALDLAGAEAIPALQRAARSPDARLRSRARAFLVEHEKSGSLRRLLRYAFRNDCLLYTSPSPRDS